MWVKTLRLGEKLLVGKLIELVGRGKFSIDEKEGNLQEGRFFSELLDGDSTILKDSLVAIDIADPGGIADSIHISWIIEPQRLLMLVQDPPHILGVDKVAILALLDTDLI